MRELIKEVPGQTFLFADMRPAPASPGVWDETRDAVRLLGDGLPDKASVTIPEAGELMAVSRRTVENWVADGTLLATYANRHDEAKRKHARIVVRSTRPYDQHRTKFLTLAELRVKRSNVGGN